MSGSSLFPLTDFSPRKSITNIETAYLSGRYGAIPNVKKSQLQVAEKKMPQFMITTSECNQYAKEEREAEGLSTGKDPKEPLIARY